MSELTITRTVADVTRDIRIKTGQFLMDAIDIGRLLFEAKAMVPAGQWSKYIEEELPFSHSWANNYMRLYKELGKDQLSLFADSQAIGNLRPTQALELLALPAEEREEFVQTHDVENMSTRELHQAIRELDEAKKAKQEAEARAEEAEASLEEAQKERKAAEESARSAREQLEAAQKNAKLSDPDLMAVQVLGQQILTQWNVILGHRKKVIAKDAANSDPIDAFLRKMLDTMVEGLGRDCNKHTT